MKKVWLLRVLAGIWLAVLLRITVFRNGCFSHGLFSGRIEWDAFAYYDGNDRSRHVLDKLGFRYERTEHDVECSPLGERRTEHFMRLIASA